MHSPIPGYRCFPRSVLSCSVGHFRFTSWFLRAIYWERKSLGVGSTSLFGAVCVVRSLSLLRLVWTTTSLSGVAYST